jgi:hypothetical protein
MPRSVVNTGVSESSGTVRERGESRTDCRKAKFARRLRAVELSAGIT